jgi:CBS domain-containing protein
MLVETVLQKKGTVVTTMAPAASLAEASALLSEGHVGVIVVCDAERKVVGILSDSDIMRHIASCPGETCSCETSIDVAMTRDVVTCKPEDTLRDVWATMDNHGLRRIPVVGANGKLSGIINLRDIFRFLREEKQLKAHELGFFIAPPMIAEEHMTDVLNTLHKEHRRIGTVLVCLRHLVDRIGKAGREADTGLLSAILDYMETFPDGIHHPKEEAYLFAALRCRKLDEVEVLDHLIEEHSIGKTLLADLRLALQALRRDSASLERFRQAVNAYVDFENAHMRREENVFMPLAARYLRNEDWRGINEAFRSDDDPLFGQEREAALDKLFKYILEEIADAPILAHGA